MIRLLSFFVVMSCFVLSSSTFASKKGPDVDEQELCTAEFKLQYPQGIDHVLFTVVIQDPMEHFKKQLTADKEKLKKRSSGTKTESCNMSEENLIINYWNYSLDMVTGSHIWELYNNSYKNRSSFKETTNCFKKAWLITRMSESDQGVVSGWEIPLAFRKGKTLEVTLTPKNSIQFNKLKKVYDSIVK